MSLLPGKLTEHGTKVTFAINDLPDTITSTVRLFADDTALYLTIEGENNSTNLQHDLYKLPVWEHNLDMANLSAISFPAISACPGVQAMLISKPFCFRLSISCLIWFIVP